MSVPPTRLDTSIKTTGASFPISETTKPKYRFDRIDELETAVLANSLAKSRVSGFCQKRAFNIPNLFFLDQRRRIMCVEILSSEEARHPIVDPIRPNAK